MPVSNPKRKVPIAAKRAILKVYIVDARRATPDGKFSSSVGPDSDPSEEQYTHRAEHKRDDRNVVQAKLPQGNISAFHLSYFAPSAALAMLGHEAECSPWPHRAIGAGDMAASRRPDESARLV